MNSTTVQVSDSFKKMTVRSIFAILFFILIYFVLISLAGLMAYYSAQIAWMLFTKEPHVISLFIGVGMLSLGFLVLLFLVKFLFSTNKVDRSHLIEIKRADEPELFAFIEEIVKEVDTDFPKRIYLSADVNACVFYDSNFWSMFLPIKKNLQIGLALMNGVTEDEFRSILAHEFGHFSQKTMKVGSYVYNVNQVIHNMLFDNASYEDWGIKLANISSFLSVFVQISFKIVQGIQWILVKVYGVVNRSYMSLSREMEFHADAVGAAVAGSKPLQTALLRLDLLQHAYQGVLGFYESKFQEAQITDNFYPQHAFLLRFLSEINDFPFEANLPQVSLLYRNRYNKSKLNIENQWASHPSIEDRIAALEALNVIKENKNQGAAMRLFKDQAAIESKLTKHLFSFVKYEKATTTISLEQFTKEQKEDYEKNAFSDLFNHYYDDKNPIQLDLDNLPAMENKSLETLYSDEMVDLLYVAAGLDGDIQVLTQIKQRELKLKTFDYDGKKHHFLACRSLIPKLTQELEELGKIIQNNDAQIFHYFKKLAQEQDKEAELVAKYEALNHFYKNEERKLTPYQKMFELTAFLHHTIPTDQIRLEMQKVKQAEYKFKAQLKEVLDEPIYQADIKAEELEYLQDYYKKDFNYFENEVYNENELQVLFTVLNGYHFILQQTFYRIKRELLAFMADLELEGI